MIREYSAATDDTSAPTVPAATQQSEVEGENMNRDQEEEEEDQQQEDEEEEIDLRTELGRVLPVDKLLNGAANAAKLFTWGGTQLCESVSVAAQQVKNNPNVQEAVSRLKPGVDKLSEGAVRVGQSIRTESTKLYNNAPERLVVLRDGAVSGLTHVGQAVESAIHDVTAVGVAGGLSAAYCGMSRTDEDDDGDDDDEYQRDIDPSYEVVPNTFGAGRTVTTTTANSSNSSNTAASASAWASGDFDTQLRNTSPTDGAMPETAASHADDNDDDDDWGYDDDDNDVDEAIVGTLGPARQIALDDDDDDDDVDVAALTLEAGGLPSV
jgi:hypothetical protein